MSSCSVCSAQLPGRTGERAKAGLPHRTVPSQAA
uniref:Uncharacterized protein n=1 Tax=Anguilla anguilla TaxID=7936 RepID=A0A0E9TRF4_ANGAN